MTTDIFSKSFQNCSESEVPGYNDCPSFLFNFQGRRELSESNRMVDNVPYMYGKKIQTMSIAPPPPTKRGNLRMSISISSNSASSCSSKSSVGSLSVSSLQSSPSQEQISRIYEKSELLSMIENLFSADSKLSEKEFQFYKNKVSKNLTENLERENTRQILTQFFIESEKDKAKAKLLLKNYMISDVSIATWSPALLKVFENCI